MYTYQTSKTNAPNGAFLKLILFAVASWLGMKTVGIDGVETDVTWPGYAKETGEGKIKARRHPVEALFAIFQGFGNAETKEERDTYIDLGLEAFDAEVEETAKAKDTVVNRESKAYILKREIAENALKATAKALYTSTRENGRNSADVLKRLHGQTIGTGQPMPLDEERFSKASKALKAASGFKGILTRADIDEALHRIAALAPTFDKSTVILETLNLSLDSPVGNYLPQVPAVIELGITAKDEISISQV